jgi:hypothetical protein
MSASRRRRAASRPTLAARARRIASSFADPRRGMGVSFLSGVLLWCWRRVSWAGGGRGAGVRAGPGCHGAAGCQPHPFGMS